MFLVKKLGFVQGIIVSSSNLKSSGFGELAISPDIKVERNLDIRSHVALIDLWYSAQCTSFKSSLHREKIIDCLVVKLYSHLCGQRWAEAEQSFTNIAYSDRQLNAFSNVLENSSIATVIKNRILLFNSEKIDIPGQIKWFVKVIDRYRVCQEPSVTEFAIALAANVLILHNSADRFNGKLQKVLSNRLLLRASRLFVLGISQKVDSFKNYSLLIPAGWQ